MTAIVARSGVQVETLSASCTLTSRAVLCGLCLTPLCSNGADALKKYEGDKDIVEAAMEAGDILQQLQHEGVSGSCLPLSAAAMRQSSCACLSTRLRKEQLRVAPIAWCIRRLVTVC